MNIFKYKNPITHSKEQSLRDCHILKVDDIYYMTGTSQPVWKGPNPGIKLFSSKDLLQWKFEKLLIDRSTLAQKCWYRDRFWAPEIHRKENKFYLSFNCHNDLIPAIPHNCGLAVGDNILGPYKVLTEKKPLGNGFKNDLSLFIDDDGKGYAYCSGGGIWQSPIDLDKGKLLWEDFQQIFSPKTRGNPDWMKMGIEGPYVIKRNSIYYMFISGWTRGYEIGYATANTPLGPWKLADENPIFGTRCREFRKKQLENSQLDYLDFEDSNDPYCEVGHNSIFTGPDGGDWICCHYFLKGKKPKDAVCGVIEYDDTYPQLGIEPIKIVNGKIKINGPSYTEQEIVL